MRPPAQAVAVARLIGLPDPVLHVLIGLGIYLFSIVLLRLSLSSWKPWLIVLGFQLINEVADLAMNIFDGETIRWRGGLVDTAVTMALPTLLVLFFKWRKRVRAS